MLARWTRSSLPRTSNWPTTRAKVPSGTARRWSRGRNPRCTTSEAGSTRRMTPVATPLFFYTFAAIAIIGALLVVTRRNAVHSALALVFTLLAIAGLYLMLYAPFVAGVQIILYAGGIMVLFLFVIMLVSIERTQKERQFNRQWLVGIVAAGALGGLFITVYTKGKGIFPDRALP